MQKWNACVKCVSTRYRYSRPVEPKIIANRYGFPGLYQPVVKLSVLILLFTFSKIRFYMYPINCFSSTKFAKSAPVYRVSTVLQKKN